MSSDEAEASVAVSSDDELERISSKRRFHYKTVDNDSDDEFGHISKDEATYGSFLDDDSDDGDRRTNKRQRRNHHPKQAPIFVKGKTSPKLDPEEEIKGQPNASETVTMDEFKETEAEVEQMELQMKQQEADRYFVSLLDQAKKSKKPSTPGTQIGISMEDSGATISTNPLGLGYKIEHDASQRLATENLPGNRSQTENRGIPGLSHDGQKRNESSGRHGPKIGTWQKHTKGIGLKLLSKMGYKGSGGLGAKKASISKPVEVKVRPVNLGLGFGNFKEASALPGNRQIEAEVRGVDPLKAEKADDAGMQVTVVGQSVLPTTKQLMNEKTWFRGSKNGRNKGQDRRQIIDYTKLVEKEPEVKVIDMRGPQTNDNLVGVDGTGDGKVPLAEELLHNVALLLSTLENKTYTSANLVKSTRRKLESSELEVSAHEKKIESIQSRVVKMENVLSIIEKIKASRQNSTASDKMGTLRKFLHEIGDIFISTGDRADAKLAQTIIPSIVGDFVLDAMEGWKPLEDDIATSRLIMEAISSVSQLREGYSSDKEHLARSLVVQFLLPKLQKAFLSAFWDPTDTSDHCINLYEMIEEMVRAMGKNDSKSQPDSGDNFQVLPNNLPVEGDDEEPLWMLLKRELIYGTIQDRLEKAIGHWKPKLAENKNVMRRLDLWIIPWLPFLEGSAHLPRLLAECKLKLQSTLKYLDKANLSPENFCDACIATINPWKTILKSSNVQKMFTAHVCPRLARFLSSCFQSGFVMDETVLKRAFKMHGLGLLSDEAFLSLVEGEVLTLWAEAMFEQYLGSRSTDAAMSYFNMKSFFLSIKESNSSKALLFSDEMICRYFNAALQMIASDGECDDQLYPPEKNNYFSVLGRRQAERKSHAAEDLLRMNSRLGKSEDEIFTESRIRLQRKQVMPSFREVVEAYASDHDISFQPRLGNNSTKDGKQVFLFGQTPLYIDGQVIYAMMKPSEWIPTSLEGLVAREAK